MDSMQPTRKITWRDMDYGAVAVVLVLAASISGQLATTTDWVRWYAALAKPPFNPPNWVFAPVWAGLYMLMALAVWRVVRRPPSPARRWALILFFIQLALNAAWPWMFFAAHSPLLGLINIIPQWTVHFRDDRLRSSDSTGSRRWRSCLCSRGSAMRAR